MLTWRQIMKIFLLIAAIVNFGEAFFLSWGGSSEPSPTMKAPWHQQGIPPQAYYYQQRYLQPQASSIQAQYTNPPTNNDVLGQPSSSSVPIPPQSQPLPAIPIQVPLQAQLTPASNIHNVQLVPCLCPISMDDFDNKPSDAYSVTKNNNNNTP